MSTVGDTNWADKSSSIDGKLAQTIIQTKINPPTVTRFVVVFPDRSATLAVFIEVRIK